MKKDLLKKAKKELLVLARKLEIRGRSRMKKADLVAAIEKAMRKQTSPRSKGRKSPARAQRRSRAPVRQSSLVRRSWREQQAVVQHAKYEVKAGRVQAPPEAPREPLELPQTYGETRIVLLVRDPYWIHVYWDVARDDLLRARQVLGREWSRARSILRVYDVTGVEFDGSNANAQFDVEISGGSNNWYINTGVPNRTYCVEIGLVSPSGRFVALARSNRATTPRDAPSEVTDVEWMVPDWEFERIYALSGGLEAGKGSAELLELMRKALGMEAGSGAPASFGVSSLLGERRERGFWFRLGTELVVYGATQPGARVTLQGRRVKLRPDGTFSARFELPDGKQVIPAVAESADGSERIEIIPTVTKKTTRKG